MFGNYAGGGTHDGECDDNSQSGSFSLSSLLESGKKYERRMGRTTSDMKPVRLGYNGTKAPTTPRRFLLTESTQAPTQPKLSFIEEEKGDQKDVSSLTDIFNSTLHLSSSSQRSTTSSKITSDSGRSINSSKMTPDSQVSLTHSKMSPDSGSFSMSLTEAAEGPELSVDKENRLPEFTVTDTSRIKERLQRLAGSGSERLAGSGFDQRLAESRSDVLVKSSTNELKSSSATRINLSSPSFSRSTTLQMNTPIHEVQQMNTPMSRLQSVNTPSTLPSIRAGPTPMPNTTPQYIHPAPMSSITPQYVLHPAPEMPPPNTGVGRSDQVLKVRGNNYRVMKLLGKGGSSRVYEAFDETKNMVVAIKRVNLAEADEAQTEGYINEINMLSQLQGEDRIVKLYDYENVPMEDLLYVVMEKGDTDLASLLKKYSSRKELTQAMIKHYWTEMLHAVSVIHKQGIIHKDLKPANFLLVAGRLKLIDFGIASSVQSDKTSVMIDSQMGTFNFMSPESIQDLNGPQFDQSGARKPCIKISFKSDVWSLGCILYNLTYGKMPFGDIKIPLMKLQAITNKDHQIPFPPLEDADPNLVSLIKSCLVRDPRERPSISQLLLHPYVTGEVVDQPTPKKMDPVSAVQCLAALEGIMSPGTLNKTRQKLKQQYNIS